MPVIRSLLLLLLLLFPACVYFNTYYNAQKYFRQAEKSRKERERAEIVLEGVGDRGRKRGPLQAEQLYDKAARNASRVLEKYQESELVDDAMFLMGRAFYWQRDYLMAVRTFLDLENNFPDSEFYSRARYWRALCHEAQLMQEQARPIYRALFEAGGGEMAAQAGFRLGEMAFDEEDYIVAAQEYQATLEVFPDAELRTELWLRLGEALFALEDSSRYDQALDAFARVLEEKPIPEVEYRARLNSGRLLYIKGDEEGALRTYIDLLSSRHFRQFEGQTRILIGQYYQERHFLDRALEEYEQVRDDFPQSSSSAMALYRTGLLYLQEHGEIERAGEYFQEVGKEKGGSEAAALAREMMGYLAQLKQLQERIHQADSLAALEAPVVISDSLEKVAVEERSDSLTVAMSASLETVDAEGQMDSLAVLESSVVVSASLETVDAEGQMDSLAVLESSVAASASLEKVAVAERSDSLTVVASASPETVDEARTPEVLEDLLAVAELYRDPERIVLPDSAIYYYREVVRRFPDSEQLPRVLYSIAWIYLEILGDEEEARPYLERLIDSYPSSEHANAARLNMGLAIQTTAEELAVAEFERIEALRLEDVAALDVYIPLLDSLSSEFPATITGARAAYLAASSYENVRGDSLEASRRYQRVRDGFPNSRYADLVKERNEARAAGLIAKLERGLKSVGGQLRPGEEIEIIALEPDSSDSVSLARKYYGFGLRAQRRGEMKQAREYYELGLEQRVNQPEVLHNLGTVMREEGFFEDAVDLYTQALVFKPGLLKSQYRLLEMYIADGRVDSANHYLREIAKRDRRNLQVEFLLQEHPELTARDNPEELDMNDLETLELETPEEDLTQSFRTRLNDLPLVRRMARPIFPDGAVVDSASVIVDILVDTLGGAEETEVFRGEEIFQGEAVAAAGDYLFYPAVDRQGKKVRVWVELAMPFKRVPVAAGQKSDEEGSREITSSPGEAALDTVSTATDPVLSSPGEAEPDTVSTATDPLLSSPGEAEPDTVSTATDPLLSSPGEAEPDTVSTATDPVQSQVEAPETQVQ